MLTTTKINGFYAVYYSGALGKGFGQVIFKDGRVIGADFAGSKYDGKYAVNPRSGAIDLSITLTVPRGVWLVQGVPAHDQEWKLPIITSLPPNFGDGHEESVSTLVGPVKVTIRRLRDLVE